MTTLAATRRLEDLAWTLTRAVDARAYYEPSHSEAVSMLSAAIATELGLPDDRRESLRLAARLHDVGKIGVPDAVLLKRGRLNTVERESIQRHSRIGADIVRAAGLEEESLWVLHHHERIDGDGYPHGLVGDEIPLEARLIAVADAYDVMTSFRTYSEAMSSAAALAELEGAAGAQFCPAAVRALRSALRHSSS